MAISPYVSINNSTINISRYITGEEGGVLVTHDISHLIAGNQNLEFILSPAPVEGTLIVSLDGLILKPSFDNNPGDYSLVNSTLTLNLDYIEDTSILLAIYQEA